MKTLDMNKSDNFDSPTNAYFLNFRKALSKRLPKNLKLDLTYHCGTKKICTIFTITSNYSQQPKWKSLNIL